MYEPTTFEEITAYMDDWKECRRLSGKSFVDYIRRKRTLNVAWAVTICLKDVEFSDILSQMYFKCSEDMKPILDFYENCLIDSKLKNDDFRKHLHSDFIRFAERVKKDNLESLLVEFNNLLTQAGIKKGFENKIVNKVFSAYLSIVQQSITYFYDDLTEYGYGISEDGTFLTVRDRYPMIDWAQEAFAEKMYLKILGKKGIDEKKAFEEMKERFAKYNIAVKNVDDVAVVCSSSNNYGNILNALMYYMTEQTVDMLPQTYKIGMNGYSTPKKWLDTDYYKERLIRRNFALPSLVKASCQFAGDIKEVYFREVIKDEKVVMLYRMVIRVNSKEDTDFSGYYIPSEKFFYSYYDVAEGARELSPLIENFVLELYFLLTIRRTEEEKQLKQYTRPLIAEEYDDVTKEPRWNNQPIISFSIDLEEQGNKTGKHHKRAYHQGVYEYDNQKIACFVRRLPMGQSASFEAISNAEKYGYELEKGYTFVTPFSRKQRHIKLLS